jgi:predicted metal-binding protein
MITKETGMTKTKMPKMRAPSLSPPSQREWDEYSRQMVQYTKEQLARKDAKIDALAGKVERMTKTKTKTKMPNLSRKASPPTTREWDEYTRQMLQYQKEQLARKDAKIAALERKVERMTK